MNVRKLRFLFIQPEFPRHYVPFFPVYEPLHGLLLAAVARDLADTVIFDRRFDSDRNLQKLLEDFQPDVIGGTTHVAGEIPNLKRMFRLAKRLLPRSVTIVGGQHATLLPEDLFDRAVDLICIGPGELTFREMMETVARGDGDFGGIDGLAIRQSDTRYSFNKPRIARGGTFSWPRFDRSLLGARYKRHYLNTFERRTTVYTVTSTGCPHRCSFCALWATTRGAYRTREPDEIAAEIASQPQPFVHITDDNTFHSPAHALAIYEAIKRRGVKKKLLAYARTDAIAKRADVLEKWKEIGLGALVVGMEAVSNRRLQAVNKATDLETNIEAQRVLDRLGIENWAHFVVMPDFQREDFDEIWQFVDRHQITYPVFVPYTPVPGTPLFFEAKARGELATFDYGFYNMQYMVLRTALPKAEWYQHFHQLYFKSCSPRTLWRRRSSSSFHWRPAIGRAYSMGSCMLKIKRLTAEQVRKEQQPYEALEPSLPPSLKRDYLPTAYYNAPTLRQLLQAERRSEPEAEQVAGLARPDLERQLLKKGPEMSGDERQALLAQLEQIAGVELDVDVGERLLRSTSFGATAPIAIARPRTTEQVQAIVKSAKAAGVSVYPISRGNNWGYGDACAPYCNSVVIDMRRMNRIIEVDAKLAYAVVEPGVSQGQLHRYLEQRGIPLWMDAVGAGPDASIVGNIMERGIGLGPYSDRAAHACAMEVVLADGQLLKIGQGAYGDISARHLVKAAPGPLLDGLFTQANLGIVTRLTFWLMPKPAAFRAFFIRLERDESITELIDRLTPLRLDGTVRCSVHCFNAMRLLGGFARFPYEQADGRSALEVSQPQLTRRLLRQHGVPMWMASGSLHGSARHVRAASRELSRALDGLKGARVNFLDGRLAGALRWAKTVARPLPMLGRYANQAEKLAVWLDFLQGKASHQTLAGSHWRARQSAGPDQDPRDSGSGMIWVSPLLPARSQDVARVQQIARETLHEHGFEHQVTLSQVSDRALCAVTSIHFDLSSKEETARASRCHDQLVDRLLATGYVPYRGHPRTIGRIRKLAPDYWRVVSRIKESLDAADVIAPGRYVPTTARSDGPIRLAREI
jgi:4-cresol dehydrogenase (hydroxylating)